MGYDFAGTEGEYNFLKPRGYDFPMVNIGYCVSGNIRQVLIFPKFARRTNSRIHESRENYYYNSASKVKWKLSNSKLREKSQE